MILRIIYSTGLGEIARHALVSSTQPVIGDRYQAVCMSQEEAIAWSSQCGDRFPEQLWLAARLRKAATAWQPLIGLSFIFVIREVLGGSATDEDVTASLSHVPGWLQLAEAPI